ncbi:MAG: hypothetical protein C5B49_12085 [Bdellovibrio sp.]|nr:MAG: hypothetical protein C5B49_12085 [Bdellovibrio sp.]
MKIRFLKYALKIGFASMAWGAFSASASPFAPSPALSPEFNWKVTRQWSAADEHKFSEFVATMGASQCQSLTGCLTSATANPFYAARTPKAKYPADCADLPFALRMYFSWMEELPFDYVNEVVAVKRIGSSGADIRYSKYGNRPVSRRSFQPGTTYNFLREYNDMRDSVSTATYRMHYKEISDFYPPTIDRKGIRPGTVVYDPSGHAAIVWKIESDGRVRLMDAHPDNSVTRITFDQKFVRSRVEHGAGFKNWRPELNLAPTAQLPGFSTEQFNREFSIGGTRVSFYDYVRAEMAGGALRFDPLAEVKTMISEICSNIHDREVAVNAALSAGLNSNPHPDRLPKNIFGTSGEWEEYATPSRDARLKVAFAQLRQESERYVTMYERGDSRIQYQPAPSRHSGSCAPNDHVCFLAASMMSVYEEGVTADACHFTYMDSHGANRPLTYTDVVGRLFALSFDPYHCAELRWGEGNEGLRTCQDDRFKQQWYIAEQGLRNQTERTYDVRMDYDVVGTAKELGVAHAPDVDLWGYLVNRVKAAAF